jgi:hypothetical protein
MLVGQYLLYFIYLITKDKLGNLLDKTVTNNVLKQVTLQKNLSKRKIRIFRPLSEWCKQQ